MSDADFLDDDPWDDDPEADCTWCGGTGEEDCNDPIQCTRRHDGDPFMGGTHDCSACGGSGAAKDQTLW